MIKIDIRQQRQRDKMILKHKKIFAINMWDWPSQCPHCDETVKQWVDAECIFYNGMCWACFMEQEMSRQHELQEEWEKLQMQEKYEKHRAESDEPPFRLMSAKDIYDQGLEDSAGFGYITIILQDGTSGGAGWCIPAIPNYNDYAGPHWWSEDFYVTPENLSKRANQEELVNWLRPTIIKGLTGLKSVYLSMSLEENMRNYFGDEEVDKANYQRFCELELEYFDTIEYKMWSGKSPVVAIQVDTLFSGVRISEKSGGEATGRQRNDLKPPILIKLHNYQSINTKFVNKI